MKPLPITKIQEPKVGECVAIYLNWLATIEVQDKCFAHQNLENNENNYITLLKYDGDGVFTELYTSQKVYFLSLLSFNQRSNFSDYSNFVRTNSLHQKIGKSANLDWERFINYYNLFKESSLVIHTFAPVDDEITKTIYEQEEKSEEISQHIFSLNKVASMRLEKEMEKIKIPYDFQHGINRKRIIKDEENAS